MFEIPQDSSNSNNAQSHKCQLSVMLFISLLRRNHSVLVLEVGMEAHDQIRHDILSLHRLSLLICFLLPFPS